MPSLTASAPGSLMLMGEHAVLHGHPALILSLEKRITAGLSLLPSPGIQIITPFGQLSFQSGLPKPPYPAPHEYLLHTLSRWNDIRALPPGFFLELKSDFEPGIGLGSSTAAVVATLKVLNLQTEAPLSLNEIFQLALSILRDLQGAASGADIAASLYEGCLFYQQEQATRVQNTPLIEWKFSGKKVPTAVAVKHVNELDEDYRNGIFEKIHAAVLEGKDALNQRNLKGFAEALIKNQKLMEALFLDTPSLKAARKALEQNPDILATKISGAGLGDGVIGLKFRSLSKETYWKKLKTKS
jgi:mevalonate kinase